MDEIRSELFKDKFHFQVLYKPEDSEYTEPWFFKLYTFVTNFYISSTHINLFEYVYYNLQISISKYNRIKILIFFFKEIV